MRPRTACPLAAALLLAGLLAPAAGAAPLESVAWDGTDLNGVPSGDTRHFRLALTVTAPAGLPLTGLPVGLVLDLEPHLAAAGYPYDADTEELKGFRLEMRSFVLHEVDAAGRILLRNVAVDVRPTVGADNLPFDAAQNPVVAVRWALPPGPNAARHFHLYFDSQAHGPKVEPASSAIDKERLAASVGPGRGTRLYVALPSLRDAMQGDEPRSLRITAPDGAQVTVHEYDQFDTPRAMRSYTIPALQAQTYVFGDGGTVPSRGLAMVTSDKPVLVEAIYRGQGTQFLPSMQGGAVGTRFVSVPAAAEEWSIVCPNTPEATASCRGTLRQGGANQPFDIGRNGDLRYSAAAGQAVQVDVTQGQVAVQRLGSGMALWPPLDGPRRASLFIGDAAPSDRLHVAARLPGTSVRIQSLEGSNLLLEEALRVDQPLDGAWSRHWSTGKDFTAGTALLQGRPTATQPGSLLVMSGLRDPHDASRYGAMVALPSPDAGYSYTGLVPKDANGNAVGEIVVFAPAAGTTVQARRADGASSSTVTQRTQVPHEPLRLEGAGVWQITADRPVVAQWLALGSEKFGGYAAGFTDVAKVEVTDSQFAARAFDLAAVEPLIIAKAGDDEVVFTVQVRNAGRKVDGSPFADGVKLELPVPAGWPAPEIAPPTLDLPPGGTESVEVRVRLPANLASTPNGLSLTLLGSLKDVAGLPPSGLVVTEHLRIAFTVQRSVQVLAGGFDERLEVELTDGAAEFPVQVVNTGSVADAYDLAMSGLPTGWEVSVDCEEGDCSGALRDDLATREIASGNAIDLTVTLALKDKDSVGRASVSFEASSKEDRSVGDGVRLIAGTVVPRSVTAKVAQPVIVVPPGGTANFTVTLTNHAAVTEELAATLQPFLPPGWPAPTLLRGTHVLDPSDPRVNIEPGGSLELTVRQPVPKEAQSGQLAFDRLRFAATDPTSTLAFDVELRAVAGRLDGLTITGPSSLALLPGQAFQVELAVASASNHNVTARVEPRATFPGTWAFKDAQGAAPPWNLTLRPGERKVVVAHGQAPAGLPPTQVALHRLEFRLVASGTTGLAALVPLSVPGIVALKADVAPDRLVRGVENLLALRVANEGNLPVDYTSSWVGLPEGWSGAGPRGHLAPASSGNATAVLDVPAGEGEQARVLTLRFLSADGETLADVPVHVGLGAPLLSAEVGAQLPLAEGRSTYRILVSNLGNASAYDVRVRLERGGEVLDQALLHQVRPGAIQQANLLGPADAEGLRVVVESAQGTAQLDVASSAAAGGKDAPVPLALAIAAVALALASRRLRGGAA